MLWWAAGGVVEEGWKKKYRETRDGVGLKIVHNEENDAFDGPTPAAPTSQARGSIPWKCVFFGPFRSAWDGCTLREEVKTVREGNLEANE